MAILQENPLTHRVRSQSTLKAVHHSAEQHLTWTRLEYTELKTSSYWQVPSRICDNTQQWGISPV